MKPDAALQAALFLQTSSSGQRLRLPFGASLPLLPGMSYVYLTATLSSCINSEARLRPRALESPV